MPRLKYDNELKRNVSMEPWDKARIIKELGHSIDAERDPKARAALLKTLAAIISQDSTASQTPITLRYAVRPTCGACGAPYAQTCACSTAPPSAIRQSGAPLGPPRASSAPHRAASAPINDVCAPKAPLGAPSTAPAASGDGGLQGDKGPIGV